MIKKIFKIIGMIMLLIISIVIIYMVIAIFFSFIPVNKKSSNDSDLVVYVKTNGVHTDIILPIKYDSIDWSNKVKYSYTIGKDTNMQYVAFGWGDKGFYLNTPDWSDLKFSTAFNAAFGLDESAMHVTFYNSDWFSPSSIKLSLSKIQYFKLVNYINNSFKRDKYGNFIMIPTNMVYGKNDSFYEAIGSYSIFNTCNTWTNSGLKACNRRACLWTPFDKGIFFQYKK